MKYKAASNAIFLKAAKSGNLVKLLDCLKSEADIDASNKHGLNALQLASKEGFPDIVEELIKFGAAVNSRTKKGNTPLHVAALAGHYDICDLLLVKHGAEVNAQTDAGFTALYMACQKGHKDIVGYLLGHGADPALATEEGYTPLAVALQQGHENSVSLLLGHDHGTSKVQLPALHIAAKKDDVKAATLILMKMDPDTATEANFTALHVAAYYGHVNMAKLLIEKGADVNFSARANITPLHIASKRGRGVEIVSLLCSHGAVIDCRTGDSLTPLHCAARSGRAAVVQRLLQHGAHITARTKNGLTPIHMAVQGDHVTCAKILLDYGARIDDQAIDLLTPLHVAAHCGSLKVARLLLDRGATHNAVTLNGFTPLHIACKKNHIRIVELLMQYKDAVNARTQTGLTPLHVAAFEGNANIAQYLIEHGAIIDRTNEQTETPLHMAVWGNHPDVVRTLLRNGAHVDAADRQHQTGLHIACMLGHEETARTLLAFGAGVEVETCSGTRPLHLAARIGQASIVDLLLQSKSSLMPRTSTGSTPLHIASKYGHLQVTQLLVEAGADPDPSGAIQPTPLYTAAHYGHECIVAYLLQRGAPPRACIAKRYTPLHAAANDKKNHVSVALDLLQYGADPNAKSRDAYTPLHLAVFHGHTDMVRILLRSGADPNSSSKNGLTSMHICAQGNQVEIMRILLRFGAKRGSRTQTGHTPLHTACYFGAADTVRLLLLNGARVNVSTRTGYTPLHEAARRGDLEIIDTLLNCGASPNAVTVDGQTALTIGQRCGHDLQILKLVTDGRLIAKGDNFKMGYSQMMEPDRDGEMITMQESDSEWKCGDDSGLSGNSSNIGKNSTKGQPKPDVRDLKVHKPMDPAEQAQLARLVATEQLRTSNSLNTVAIHQRQGTGTGPVISVENTTGLASSDYQIDPNYKPDNIDVHSGTNHAGKIVKKTFLISFLVDARGGAMRGCRHSGVRIIIPPRKAPMPMRITCRYLKKEKLVHPPPLSEGEALASRILEIGPAGARFLGPVILEIPHFASLRGREREIMIIRSDDGEHWKEHQLEATEDAVQEVLNESFDPEELSQLDDLNTTRITRILTNDFPQYFAVVSRIRQEVHAVGPEGGMIASTVVSEVQAIFPEGALTKTIKVSLQAQPIAHELVTKLHGNRVAVSPIVTVEPRRRKFHKPITLCIPLPQYTRKNVVATIETVQTNNQNEDIEEKEVPTLRLLCSITGGIAPAKWEDITGTTQLTFSTEHVSFTTTVSARFWLMDCSNPLSAATMAQEIYNEAVQIPYMAKFAVFARRSSRSEWQVRLFCITDDKEDKTLERQEHYTEIAKSRDVEVLAGKHQHLEFFGSVAPATKQAEPLNLRFIPFQENRLMFSMKKKDPDTSDLSLNGKIAFIKDPRGDHSHNTLPICTLAITLPSTITASVTDGQISGSRSSSLSRKYHFARTHFPETIYDTEISIQELARELGPVVWESLARALRIPDEDQRQIHNEYAGQETVTVLKVWLEREGTRASGHNLVPVIKQLGREDLVKKYLSGTKAMNGWHK